MIAEFKAMSIANKTKVIIALVLLIIAIVLSVMLGYLRFSQPELTETQLMINYWYLWIPIVASLLSGALLAVWAGRENASGGNGG